MRALAVALVIAACGGTPAPPPPPPPDPFADDPIAVFADLEDRLTSARWIELDADVRATGALAVELAGLVHVERERASWVKFAGAFAGGQLRGAWSSLETVDPFNVDVQQDVWADALVIGTTRMGVLHNWAMVIARKDPDHGRGDPRTWVKVDGIAWKDGSPATRTLTFRILVEDVPSGEASLVLDERGLPARREQVVRFPEGEMRVVETYSRFDVK